MRVRYQGVPKHVLIKVKMNYKVLLIALYFSLQVYRFYSDVSMCVAASK